MVALIPMLDALSFLIRLVMHGEATDGLDVEKLVCWLQAHCGASSVPVQATSFVLAVSNGALPSVGPPSGRALEEGDVSVNVADLHTDHDMLQEAEPLSRQALAEVMASVAGLILNHDMLQEAELRVPRTPKEIEELLIEVTFSLGGRHDMLQEAKLLYRRVLGREGREEVSSQERLHTSWSDFGSLSAAMNSGDPGSMLVVMAQAVTNILAEEDEVLGNFASLITGHDMLHEAEPLSRRALEEGEDVPWLERLYTWSIRDPRSVLVVFAGILTYITDHDMLPEVESVYRRALEGGEEVSVALARLFTDRLPVGCLSSEASGVSPLREALHKATATFNLQSSGPPQGQHLQRQPLQRQPLQHQPLQGRLHETVLGGQRRSREAETGGGARRQSREVERWVECKEKVGGIIHRGRADHLEQKIANTFTFVLHGYLAPGSIYTMLALLRLEMRELTGWEEAQSATAPIPGSAQWVEEWAPAPSSSSRRGRGRGVRGPLAPADGRGQHGRHGGGRG